MTARPAADGFLARVATATLGEVPLEALQQGLRLPLHDFLGLELVGLAPVVVRCRLTDAVRSAGLPLHGGVVATLVDVAANVAAATGGRVDVRSSALVTGRVELEYRAQPRGGAVVTTAEVLGYGRRDVTSRAVVTDEHGRTIATGTVTSRVVPRRGAPVTPSSRPAATC